MKAKQLAAIFAALAASGAAVAAGHEGYLTDARGEIVRSGTNLCWHTGYWTPAMATPECDPVLAAPVKAEAQIGSVRPAAVKKELRANVLFSFDRSNITATGKAELDRVATDIKSLKALDFVLVIGHADRIGSAAYNLALSKKRAAAVRKYLVAQGVPAASIKADGVGETQPITLPGECKGKGAKLRACLAKDRRVEIQVVGNNSN